MSLAQSIIDTAYNMTRKPRETGSRFAQSFINATRGKIPDHLLNEMTMQNMLYFEGIPELATLIKKSIRFSIDTNVADAMIKMDRTPTDTLLKALKFAEPPHRPTWVEFSQPGDNMRIGWLVDKTGDTLHVYYAFSHSEMNHAPYHSPNDMRLSITENGFRPHNQGAVDRMMKNTPNGPQIMGQNLENIGRSALCLLLLLNSRSRILKIEPPEDEFDKINRRRRKNGKEEKVSLNTIRFDIARVMRGGMSAIEAAREMAASLVRGHFKVRQTGVFFWSPFVRNATSEEHKQEVYQRELGEERREVTASGPTMLPQ